MASVICLIGLIFLFLWIKNININSSISTFIKNKCTDIDNCQVRLEQFTKFDWDQVCFVDSGATLTSMPELIPASLPKKYSYYQPKLIFINQEKIAHFEEVEDDLEFTPTGLVKFAIDNGCYPKDSNLIFNVKSYVDGKGPFYVIYRLADIEKLKLP